MEKGTDESGTGEVMTTRRRIQCQQHGEERWPESELSPQEQLDPRGALGPRMTDTEGCAFVCISTVEPKWLDVGSSSSNAQMAYRGIAHYYFFFVSCLEIKKCAGFLIIG